VSIFTAGAKEAAEKTFILALRYALAFGRVELFVFNGLAARLKRCPDKRATCV